MIDVGVAYYLGCVTLAMKIAQKVHSASLLFHEESLASRRGKKEGPRFFVDNQDVMVDAYKSMPFQT